MSVDFEMQNMGSVVWFLPLTDEARRVMDEEMGLESWQMWGEGFVVDRNLVPNLMDALHDNGLMV
jgi:hypothetical protein